MKCFGSKLIRVGRAADLLNPGLAYSKLSQIFRYLCTLVANLLRIAQQSALPQHGWRICESVDFQDRRGHRIETLTVTPHSALLS